MFKARLTRGEPDQRVADGETNHDVDSRMLAALDLISGAHNGDAVAVVGHIASQTLALSIPCALGCRVWGAPLPACVALSCRGPRTDMVVI